MLLGVVSDTHGRTDNTREAIRMLESLEVDCVIHCGDIGSVDVIHLFPSQWPTHFVYGNVDRDTKQLDAAILEAGHECHGRFGRLDLADISIAFLHGDDARQMRRAIADPAIRLVCYGHSHRREHHWEENTLVLNPGAVHRASPHSLAVVRLPQLSVTDVPF